MPERERIFEILYADVMSASRTVDNMKTGSPSHQAALAVLEKAVERYTDFSLDGKVPDDLKQVRPTSAA